MSHDFYRTGKDCGNTFDRETFDIDIDELARTTIAAARRTRGNVRFIAAALALKSLRTSDDWIDPKDWVRGTDFDPKEDGPLTEAYASWKAGYIDCAVPELTEWILDAIERRS